MAAAGELLLSFGSGVDGAGVDVEAAGAGSVVVCGGVWADAAGVLRGDGAGAVSASDGAVDGGVDGVFVSVDGGAR